MNFFNNKKENNETHLDMNNIIPQQFAKFEKEENDNITLLKPKFNSNFSLKYIIPRMKHPYYSIHLDEIGTAVWNSIDGKRNAVEIGEKLKGELGDRIEPVFERLGLFLATLKQQKFIKW